MIIKIERYNKNNIEQDKELIFNVERANIFTDDTDNQVLYVEIKNKEIPEYIPLTYTDEENSHPAIVSAIWVMNEEGKTVERLI